MPDENEQLQEQHESIKNNDKPIGVDDNGKPIVPPNIANGTNEEPGIDETKRDTGNDTLGVP